MSSTTWKQSISQYAGRYWGLIVLLIWGGALLGFGVIRTTPYGLDEATARGLLLIWSISDRIINPIVTLGIPDFRALFFIPLGAYWPGSIIAAKVLTLILAFVAIMLFYRWGKESSDTETAMIASALLLISPQFINEIDAAGTGIFLLLTFGIGIWLNQAYRKSSHAFSGWLYVQMLWVAITVTLHPAGLAYPLALAWSWYKEPQDPKRQRFLLLGVGLVTLLTVGLRRGWGVVDWWTNPLISLSQAHQAVIGIDDPNLLVGIMLMTILVIVIWLDRQFLIKEFVGRLLLLGVALGLSAAGTAWVILVLALIFFRGTALLIKVNQKMPGDSLMAQRGVVLIVGIILTTTFMLTDKSHAYAIELGTLNPQDQLIQLLAQDLADAGEEVNFKAASQWPGRTMIAVRRDVFPLPHAAADGPTLLKNIKGITHMIFDHNDIKNRELAKNIAEMGPAAETLFLDKGGVVVAIHEDKTAESPHASEPDTQPAP